MDTSENIRGQQRKDKVYQGIVSRQISGFLGDKNWSKSKVADLLRLHSELDPEIVKQEATPFS